MPEHKYFHVNMTVRKQDRSAVSRDDLDAFLQRVFPVASEVGKEMGLWVVGGGGNMHEEEKAQDGD